MWPETCKKTSANQQVTTAKPLEEQITKPIRNVALPYSPIKHFLPPALTLKIIIKIRSRRKRSRGLGARCLKLLTSYLSVIQVMIHVLHYLKRPLPLRNLGPMPSSNLQSRPPEMSKLTAGSDLVQRHRTVSSRFKMNNSRSGHSYFHPRTGEREVAVAWKQ